MSEGIPEGWQLSTISDFAHVKGGKRLPKGRPFAPTRTAFPYLRVSDFKNGTVSFDDIKYVHEEDRNHIKRYTISKNDLYISIAGSLGIVGEVPARLDGTLLTENAAKIVLKDRGSVSKTFLKYYLLSEDAQKHFLQSKGTGGGVPKLALFRIEETPILLPTSPEQQKIASILTSVDEVIEKTEAQIGKLQDLKKGMMQELVTKGIGHTEFKDSPVGRIPKGWDIAKTGSIAKSIVPGRNKPKSLDGEIPWITISDIDEVFLDKSKLGLGVSREVLSEAQGKSVPRNAVIMTVVGEFGISAISTREIVINQQLHGFVCSGKVIPLFLCFCLRNQKQQMEKLATQTTISYMNKDNAESVYVPLPPKEEQERIAKSIYSIEEAITSKTKQLAAFKNSKIALMQDLLTGKVRVKTD